MTEQEERVWRYMVMNRHLGLTPEIIAMNCDVSADLAESCMERIGSDLSLLRAQSREDGDRKEMGPEKPSHKPTRVRTLETAINLTGGDRNRSYGPPFDNLSDCAHLWNAYINANTRCIEATADGSYKVKLLAEDVAWLMVLVKMTRSFQSGYHPDNYTDASAYSAIAGECREIQMEEN